MDILHEHGAHSAALGHDRNMPRFRKGKGKVTIGFNVRVGVDDSLAVRPEDTNAVLPGPGQYFLLDGFAFRSYFFKTGAVNDHKLDPFFPAFIDCHGREFGGDTEMCHIHFPRHIFDRGVGFKSANLIGFGIYRVDWPFIFVFDQVAGYDIPDGQRLLGSADNRYCFRIK